jgi:hypothetical protein
VEPTTPCATDTLEGTQDFRQPIFNRRGVAGQGSNRGKSNVGTSSRSTNQLSKLHGGSSSTRFKMAGVDPTIILPEFRGEDSEDHEKNLFIFENIWEAKKITNEDTKVMQLAITFRDHALYWYMSFVVNNQ